MYVSQSLRTKQMDDLMNIKPVYDSFSENKYLDYYKAPLVQTGSVDHIVPFKHSNDKRGIRMSRMRQNDTPKIYPNSTANELAKEYMKKTGNSVMGDRDSLGSPLIKSKVKVSTLVKQPIVEEAQDSMPSEREGMSLNRGSRSSFASFRRHGRNKRKEVSDKEKVDSLVKIYFK